MPASVITVARFLVTLGMTCKFSTCNNYLSSVVTLHKFFGEDSSFRDSYVIQLVIKGLGNKLGKEVSQKIGLTPQELVNLYHKLEFSNLNTLTMWTALIFCFRTLLRKSNVVQSTTKDMGMVVTRQDLEFNTSGLLVNVYKTKTIQAKEHVLQIPVFFTKCAPLCAASLLSAHLLRTRHIKEGPLFFMITKNQGWRPLLYNELLKFFKKIVPLIGLNPTQVGLHSMRRAGASYLQSIGISLVDIMCAGDWRSLAALSYLITPLSRKKDIETLACTKLENLQT